MQSLDTGKWGGGGEEGRRRLQRVGRRAGHATPEKDISSQSGEQRLVCAQVTEELLPGLCSAHPALGLVSGPLAPGPADLKTPRF